MKFVREKLPPNKKDVKAVVKSKNYGTYKGLPVVPLLDFVHKAGICRHHGFLLFALCIKLQQEQLLPANGKIFHHRADETNDSSHVFVIWKFSSREDDFYLLDSFITADLLSFTKDKEFLQENYKFCFIDCVVRYISSDKRKTILESKPDFPKLTKQALIDDLLEDPNRAKEIKLEDLLMVRQELEILHNYYNNNPRLRFDDQRFKVIGFLWRAIDLIDERIIQELIIPLIKKIIESEQLKVKRHSLTPPFWTPGDNLITEDNRHIRIPACAKLIYQALGKINTSKKNPLEEIQSLARNAVTDDIFDNRDATTKAFLRILNDMGNKDAAHKLYEELRQFNQEQSQTMGTLKNLPKGAFVNARIDRMVSRI